MWRLGPCTWASSLVMFSLHSLRRSGLAIGR